MPGNISKVLVVGAGKMAKAYAKALTTLNIKYVIVGRGEEKVNVLKSEFPEANVFSGGITAYLQRNQASEYAIIATPITGMTDVASKLLDAGVKYILLEKPGSLYFDKLAILEKEAVKKEAEIFIAYNRRFYKSVELAQKIIAQDGGAISVHFEFTEMIYKIKKAKHGLESMKRWVIANSTHVIDTVFFLAGKPQKLDAEVKGTDVEWHPSGSIFLGKGETILGVPFTYHANWGSAGRWRIELMTAKHKLFFSPMEVLKVQKKGEMTIEEVNSDYSLDEKFKPGIYKQTEAFLLGKEREHLLSLEEQISLLKIYNKIGGYSG